MRRWVRPEAPVIRENGRGKGRGERQESSAARSISACGIRVGAIDFEFRGCNKETKYEECLRSVNTSSGFRFHGVRHVHEFGDYEKSTQRQGMVI